MHEIWLLIAILPLLGVLGAGSGFASPEKSGHSPQDSKKGILLVAFGTRSPSGQKAYEQIDAQARKAFPGTEIRWAYTSKVIRAKLAAEGKHLDSPETALARMMDDGYSHVAVLSLHVIPGEEFHDLNRNARLFAEMSGGFEKLLVARPLLSSHADMVRVAAVLLGKLPEQRTCEEAVLYVGHGTEKHPADAMYPAMNYIFQTVDANILVGTISGFPDVEEIVARLLDKKVKRVYLMPFMSVAGDHVQNDMAGDKPESWKSILLNKGFACEVITTGIAEYPEIVEIWLDHLREEFAKLQQSPP